MAEEKILNVNNIDYIISSDGRIYSTAQRCYHKEIEQRLTRDGYLTITTGVTGKRRMSRVHRLVAKAFLPNPENLPEVNHLDYDRTNNNVNNLEWCTHIDNIKHSAGTSHYSHFGEDNSNYGNDTLKKKYAADPELSKIKNSRPGARNGRCRKIKLIDINTRDELNFDYMRQAGQYLIDNNFTVSASKVDAVVDRIVKSIKNDKILYGKFKAEFIN